MSIRPRRNRQSPFIRELVSEVQIRPEKLIYPLFLLEGSNQIQPIASMPGIERLSLDKALTVIEEGLERGIKGFAPFPYISKDKKDKAGSYSHKEENFYLKAIVELKKRFPEACLITDVALDPYSSDGHDGIVKDGKILNDETLEVLVKMAVAQAQAGSDIVAPSDMMDGRVGAIRKGLDQKGFQDTSIMSYTAKYASAFYGPFREALDSAPQFGDKKTYQMDPRNRREALREAQLDIQEGADYLMVKPALSYLDIIADLKRETSLPIVAYNVSGEYAMVKAAAQNGWVDEARVRDEMLISFFRAGADVVITYFALQYLRSN